MTLRFLGAAIATLIVPMRVSAQELDEKLGKRIAKLDERLLASLADLAKKYDAEKHPEAAHFFASCAVGFGSKDSGVAVINGAWETDLFVGKVRGGEELKDGNAITVALRPLTAEYKKVFDSLLEGRRGRFGGEAAKKLLHDCAVKYEIAHNAHEYIQSTQRFNALRRGMRLRAILWDFEMSRKLVVAAWYMGETGDTRQERASDKGSIYYDPIVETAKAELATSPHDGLKDHPECLRSYALVRQDILNPNSRRLWLAHWSGGKSLAEMTLYAIPQLPYREDIPTPSKRYENKTVVKDWVDTEDTLIIGGNKVPYVRYPYDGESDAPWAFSNGQGAQEAFWDAGEYKFLRRAGVPIMLRWFTNGAVSDAEVQVRDKSGKLVGCRVYLSGDARVGMGKNPPTLLMVPVAHLEKGVSYSVSVQCTVKEVPFEAKWTFTTGSK